MARVACYHPAEEMRTVLKEEREFGRHRATLQMRDVKGARKITVRVNHEGVVVTKPRWVARRDAEEFLVKCRLWLERELDRWSAMRDSTLQDAVLFLGVERPIRLASAPPVRFGEGVFWSPGETAEERLQNVLAWMRRRANPVIREAVSRWSAIIGKAPRRVSVRDQTSRWGSCSSTGSLSLNWRLVMAPPEVLEYLVVHELAHLIEHNHSRRFWAIVARHCPDYRQHETWLNEHNDWLIAVGR